MVSKISNLVVGVGDFIMEKIISKATISAIIFVLGLICGYAWMWATVN